MLAGKIVRTHLNEAPGYYTRLAQTEKEAKLQHDRKRKTTKKAETVKTENTELFALVYVNQETA